MKKHGKRLVILFMLCAMLILQPSALSASSVDGPHELIILFDLSGSMAGNDPGFLAPDALQQLVGSLPSHWHIGLVTFSTDTIDEIAPSADSRTLIHAALDAARYGNWTNAGAGLHRTIELFSATAASRTIVYMTDGEKTNMPTTGAMEEAALLAETAIAQIIASDIPVHTVVVGSDLAIQHDLIMGLSHATGGITFQDVASEELSGIAFTLAFDVLGTSGNLVGTAQITEALGSFIVRLPPADLARVLITAESPVDNIAVSGGGGRVELYTGERFALVEIVRPTEPEVTITFTASGTSTAELILEWDLQLMVEVCDLESEARLWLTDGTGTNVLADPFFANRTWPLSVDGVQRQMRVENGYIRLELEPAEDQTHTLQLHLDTHGVNAPPGPTEIVVNAPALPEEPESNMKVLIAIIIGLILLIALLIYLFYLRPKLGTPVRIMPSFESKFEFTGKLNIYVTRTPDDVDISPQTFDLFRWNGKEVSLREMLEKCQITAGFPGAEHIYFVAGKQGLLQVVNDSDCTILIGTDILVKTRAHTLRYGEKIHVACEDEASELELHYKSVKPSERSAVVTPLIRS